MSQQPTDSIRHIEFPVKDSKHTVVADIDPVSNELLKARVVDGNTGIRHTPDDKTLVALANMFIAEKVSQDALGALEKKKSEIGAFPNAVKALPVENPAVQPHYAELATHQKRYGDYEALKTFLLHKVEHGALNIIAEHEPKNRANEHDHFGSHGLHVNLKAADKGSRQL